MFVIFRLFEHILFLVKIRLFQSLEKNLAIFRILRQTRFEQRPNLQIVDRASFHRLQVFVLGNILLVHDFAESCFEHLVEPYPCCASVAFHEWMRNVHFHVFLNNLFKCSLRHFLDGGEGFFEIQTVREAEISLRDVLSTYFSRERVQVLEQILMNRDKARRRADLYLVDVA